MKKLIALSLCIISIFTFAACNEKIRTKNDVVDLEYYAKLGQIPEVKYRLGSDCDKVEKELQAEFDAFLADDRFNTDDDNHDHDTEEIYFDKSDKGDYIFINNGSKYYLYKEDEKKDGISCVVTFGEAFGFKMGTFVYDIKTSMASIEFVEEEITAGSIFFEDFLSTGSVLKVEINDTTVMFVFQEGELYCTAMYKTDSWK